jgi:hypothetical protein
VCFPFDAVIQDFTYNQEEVWCQWAPLTHALLNGEGGRGLAIHRHPCDSIEEEKSDHVTEGWRESQAVESAAHLDSSSMRRRAPHITGTLSALFVLPGLPHSYGNGPRQESCLSCWERPLGLPYPQRMLINIFLAKLRKKLLY